MLTSSAFPPVDVARRSVELTISPSRNNPSNGNISEKGDATVTMEMGDNAAETLDNVEGQNVAIKSTRDDNENVQRMGRNRELVQNFRLVSVASFVAIATAA